MSAKDSRHGMKGRSGRGRKMLREIRSAGSPFVFLTCLLGIAFFLFLGLLVAALW
jgi:hypothetical protein